MVTLRDRHDQILSYVYGGLGLVVVLLTALWVAAKTGTDFLGHSAYDTYTLQAMRWREGAIALPHDYPWLELAIYQGRYYVSFPPVPALPMLALSFFFGMDTPSALVTLLYLLGGYAAAYCLLRRHLPCGHAACCAVFVTLGGSLLDIAVSGGGVGGGVWYQAQTLAFLLTMLCFFLLDSGRKPSLAAGLCCLALAVGCRPFHALYVPFALLTLFQRVRRDTFLRTARAMLPYVAVPALIAVAYGVYNAVRFGNPLEFGHAYLPEIAQAGEASLFSLRHIGANLRNIFSLPTLDQGVLRFAVVGGFAVYLTNPMFVAGYARLAESAVRKKAALPDFLLASIALLHALLLLSHRTNGGWQYGTRYLCDIVPALTLLFARAGKPTRLWEGLVMGALIALNVVGTVAFHFM